MSVSFVNNVGTNIFTFSIPVKCSKNIRPEIMSDNIPYFNKSLVFDLQARGVTYDITGICTVDEKENLELIINSPDVYDGNLFLQIDGYEDYTDNGVWFDSFEFSPLEGTNKFSFHFVLVVGDATVTDNFNIIVSRITGGATISQNLKDRVISYSLEQKCDTWGTLKIQVKGSRKADVTFGSVPYDPDVGEGGGDFGFKRRDLISVGKTGFDSPKTSESFVGYIYSVNRVNTNIFEVEARDYLYDLSLIRYAGKTYNTTTTIPEIIEDLIVTATNVGGVPVFPDDPSWTWSLLRFSGGVYDYTLADLGFSSGYDTGIKSILDIILDLCKMDYPNLAPDDFEFSFRSAGSHAQYYPRDYSFSIQPVPSEDIFSFKVNQSEIVNYCVVYGRDVSDNIISSDPHYDNSSIAGYGMKNKIYSDSSINTKERADAVAEGVVRYFKDSHYLIELITKDIPSWVFDLSNNKVVTVKDDIHGYMWYPGTQMKIMGYKLMGLPQNEDIYNYGVGYYFVDNIIYVYPAHKAVIRTENFLGFDELIRQLKERIGINK